MTVKRITEKFELAKKYKSLTLTVPLDELQELLSDYAALKAELDELNKQVVSLAVENSALKEQTPDVRSACMFEAIEKAEKFMDEGMPELAMVEAFEILKMKRTPTTDAVIANIQAQGVEKFGDDLLSDLRGDCWDEHDVKYIEMALNHHLNELSKGASND